MLLSGKDLVRRSVNLDLACLPGPHGTDPSSLPVSYGFVVFFIGVLVLLWLERPYA